MKNVVILHGFPDLLQKDKSPLFNYFNRRNYKIIMPNLLSDNFQFNIDNVSKIVDKELANEKLNVIMGISMGGLIAPYIAKRHPEAKLVLIGTGARFRTAIPIYNFLIRIVKKDRHPILIRIVKGVPKCLYRFIYKYFNRKNLLTDSEYKRRADEGWNGMTKIKLEKIKEVIKFVTEVDNSKLLTQLTNKAFIFSGRQDSVMPERLSRELNTLIPNSKIIVSDRLHYDVFTDEDCHHLDRFLNSKG